MSITIEKINSADYVYSSYIKWGLKKYTCDVSYFTEKPLDDLYHVICSVLDSTEEGCYDKRSLGTLLGFSMVDQQVAGRPNVYGDIAEVGIFEDILTEVKKEHLIKIDNNNNIVLTKLGRLSVQEGKHYRFFVGKQDVYEHSNLKSQTPIAMLMFPFYQDMGIYTTLKDCKGIWPEDEEVESFIYNETNPLKKRLEFQSKETSHICRAELHAYFDIDVKNVFVKLYRLGDEYIPAIMNGEELAIRATELINEDLNEYRKENIILECLFQKLLDDKEAIFNFKTLFSYVDLIDYEELTKDSRTFWADSDLVNLIVERATPTCWRNISRHCNIEVLKNRIDEFQDNLDWVILSTRIDDKFLMDRFHDYPWDLETISEDANRSVPVIEQLILLQKETQEDWNWEELEWRLSQEFVLHHLDIVKVDLATYTKDTEEVRHAILNNIDQRWDWHKIEKEFDLQFIYDHILALGTHFVFTQLFDRIFIDLNWGEKFATNPFFKDVVAEASKEGGSLSSAIFNNKNYRWTSNLISLFVSNGLLSWASTPYMQGFECNPNLVWTKDLFVNYSGYITTDEGKRYLSSKIEDIAILIDEPNFEWNWEAISCNVNLLSEKQLYLSFGCKLNWSFVLKKQNDAQFLQSIDGINTMIGNDSEAWSAFSSIAEIEYVVSKYKKDEQFPWDWTVLTERMFSKLRLENLGNKDFIDKWDWNYLSEYVDVQFLNTNLDRFKNYWNWELCLPRILSGENRFDLIFLDKIGTILTKITDQDKCKAAWTALTSQYLFKELKKLIKETVHRQGYSWDMNYFCQHKEFYVFRDLEECRNIVDWEMLSSSTAIDNSFKFNPKLGIKAQAWPNEVRKILSDVRNRWNYILLSRFESLCDEEWFIAQYKNKLDWEYISQKSKIFCTKDKQQLNEIIQAYKKFIDFNLLSERVDVDIKQIYKISPGADYNFNKLVERGGLHITIEFLKGKPDYPWDWNKISSLDSFVPTAKFLLEHIECDLNWRNLSKQNNRSIWGDKNLVIAVASNAFISNQIDWLGLSSKEFFPLSNEVLKVVPLNRLNWKSLSRRESIIPLIEEYADYLDWRVLSCNKYLMTGNITVLDKHKDYLDWSCVCRQDEFKYTNDILDRFAEYIDWTLASEAITINFSRSLVEKYKDKWNWPLLVKNKAFHNKVNISEIPYVRQINNIVDFISKFPRKPKAYHFTHMDNAVKIIRTMKLQSRNYAEGNFSNSAGSNVDCTDKAHRFARFYFSPKSPTQFYNECLGKDTSAGKYYPKALKLGLPKCPLPVFFIFDVGELLSVMPDLCYYSNGNMQKDSSRYFKVIEDPNRIKAKEIYIDSYDTFNERQQEFLVDGELDISKINNIRICCYDDTQNEMLKNELRGTKWEDVITTDSSLYQFKNKELTFRDLKDRVEISTDYQCPFEFRVSYKGLTAPTIVNKENVLRQRSNNIYVSSSVEVIKDVPFEIYFEVNTPRTGSWLVYKN